MTEPTPDLPKRQLTLMRQVLRECRSLNSGNCIIERINFLIKAAKTLDGWSSTQQGFTQFLQGQAEADIKPIKK